MTNRKKLAPRKPLSAILRALAAADDPLIAEFGVAMARGDGLRSVDVAGEASLKPRATVPRKPAARKAARHRKAGAA